MSKLFGLYHKLYFRKWFRLINFLKKLGLSRLVAFTLIGIWLALIWASFSSFRYNFEGNLVVREMSFTYVGDNQKPFINSIERVKELTLHSSLADRLILRGEFSTTIPGLKSKLDSLEQLTIELPYSNSQLFIASLDSKAENDLNLGNLRITSNTRVDKLAFESSRNENPQLSFQLKHTNEDSDSNSITSLDIRKEMVGTLELQIGQQPLKIIVEKANIPEIGLQDDTFSFELRSDFEDKFIQLISPSQIYITPDLAEQDIPTADLSSFNWFWQDFTVKDLRFLRDEETGNVSDTVSESSTILSGEVRMRDKILKLQESQLLIVPLEDPGIQKIRYLRIQYNPLDRVAGLRTLVSGKASKIAVGFYKDFPVETIALTWFSKYPKEAVSALLAFVAALTGFFLPKLFKGI